MKLWLLSSAIVSTACLAACGPAEDPAEEPTEETQAGVVTIGGGGGTLCTLTDDVASVCGCNPTPSVPMYLPPDTWPTNIYYIWPRSDRDYFKVEIPEGPGGYYIKFETLPGNSTFAGRYELTDTVCGVYDPSCRPAGNPVDRALSSSESCSVYTGLLVRGAGPTYATFYVSGTPSTKTVVSPYVATGSYRVKATITGRDGTVYVPPNDVIDGGW
jgi:hypothetical protein